jgi:acyl-ACP thioesterase
VAIARRVERTYRVRFDEAGPDGDLRASGFLRYAQDLAWLHSEGAGFGRDWYRERGLTWLVRGIELDLLGDVGYGSELDVSTEVIGFRRVWARRRTEFDPRGGERTIAVAATDWVLLSDGGRLVRPPAEILDAFGATADFSPMRLKLPEPPEDATTTGINVRHSDLDPLAHVNNATYLDYIDDIFLAATGEARLPLPRRYRAEFVAPAEPGARLVARTWAAGDAWWFALDADDRPSLRASLEVSPASWVGG